MDNIFKENLINKRITLSNIGFKLYINRKEDLKYQYYNKNLKKIVRSRDTRLLLTLYP